MSDKDKYENERFSGSCTTCGQEFLKERVDDWEENERRSNDIKEKNETLDKICKELGEIASDRGKGIDKLCDEIVRLKLLVKKAYDHDGGMYEHGVWLNWDESDIKEEMDK